ncbi:hypothetical protein PC116_g16702 [Phytophthora cactorum]|uniref:Uncharacterized protein n=1 Tax=Phytophthora cactorum TaxID=29920 RepID=A0A329SSF3_9STRA|nr:hypothetical protein PC114_g15606 [Phytophthora cactorum]KAG2924641.1 hypothetical protein PC117_g15357 [Phytophthora cactorum]KAG3006189.1 hypothetical protein PC119_g15038 [Phytophthora cactorum]KAG3011060.1 hypothetical protein PC120_g14660 [Phytophthora cactorum]KAG3157074.1 hypothetical protein C6341_g14883 [Phytophthora cactorum]
MENKHMPVTMAVTAKAPKNHREAVRSAHARDWREALIAEFKALKGSQI